MRRFPEPIQNAAAAFSRLPGVGPKTALRYVFYLLRQPKADIESVARSLLTLADRIRVCTRCFTYTAGADLCEICADARRDKTVLCVVEEPRDISTMEATDVFKGHYHVLGGTLNPIEGITADVLRVKELEDRLVADPGIKEVILAFSPNVQGETTIMFLSKRLGGLNRSVTRLARGLPMGATIEYADEITLGDALKGRRNAS